MTKRFRVLSGDVSGVPCLYGRPNDCGGYDMVEAQYWKDMDSSAVEEYGKYNVRAGVVHLDMYSDEDMRQAFQHWGLTLERNGDIADDRGHVFCNAYRELDHALAIAAECCWSYGLKEVWSDDSGNNLRVLLRDARNSL